MLGEIDSMSGVKHHFRGKSRFCGHQSKFLGTLATFFTGAAERKEVGCHEDKQNWKVVGSNTVQAKGFSHEIFGQSLLSWVFFTKQLILKKHSESNKRGLDFKKIENLLRVRKQVSKGRPPAQQLGSKVKEMLKYF